MTLIYSLLMLLLVILIHEFGHFAMAKLVGIGVAEFSIGMGPELYSTTKNGTQYNVRLLPVGGYVLLEGDDEDSIQEIENEDGKKEIVFLDNDSPTAFRNAKIWKRIAVMAFGAFMNFVFSLLIFIVLASRIVTPTTVIESFVDGLPAADSELKTGDKVISVNGESVRVWEDISAILNKDNSKTIATIEVERDSKTYTVELVPGEENGRRMIGISPKYAKDSIGGSVEKGYRMMMTYADMIFDFLKGAVKGKASIGDLSGPVGVVNQIGKAVNSGIDDLLFFLAYVNLNLGIFNLLPIPALDGSKILFLFVEAIRGKEMSRKVESAILTVGVVLLILLMLAVTYKDVISVIRG